MGGVLKDKAEDITYLRVIIDDQDCVEARHLSAMDTGGHHR
jgi:hypothetical protein